MKQRTPDTTSKSRGARVARRAANFNAYIEKRKAQLSGVEDGTDAAAAAAAEIEALDARAAEQKAIIDAAGAVPSSWSEGQLLDILTITAEQYEQLDLEVDDFESEDRASWVAYLASLSPAPADDIELQIEAWMDGALVAAAAEAQAEVAVELAASTPDDAGTPAGGQSEASSEVVPEPNPQESQLDPVLGLPDITDAPQRAKDLIAWIGDDAARAAAVLPRETQDPRKSVIAHIEGLTSA